MSSHKSNSTDDLEQRVQRVEQEVDELRDITSATDENGNEWSVTKLVTELGLSRRQALGVIVAIGGGASFLTALADVTSAQAAGGTLYVDQIGDSSNRVSDIYVDTTHNLNTTSALQNNIDGQSFDITNLGTLEADNIQGAAAGIFEDGDSDGIYTQTTGTGIETGSVDTDAVTMYVRSSGSDANDGLSSGNAKATIQSAIEDAPIQGDQTGAIVIDLAAETLTAGQQVLALNNSVPVHIRGTTDGSGNPTTTIDCSGISKQWLFCRVGGFRIEDIVFTNQPTGKAFVYIEGPHARADIRNCDFTQTADANCLSLASGGQLNTDGNTSITFDTDASNHGWCVAVVGGEMVLGGSVDVTGAGSPTHVLNAFDGSGTVDITADITGNGNVTSLINAQSAFHVKVGNNTYNGADHLVRIAEQAAVIAQDGLSNTTVNSRLVEQNEGGYFANGDDNAEWWGVPQYNGTPPEATDSRYASLWCDSTGGNGRLVTTRYGTNHLIPLGVHDQSSPTASDVETGGLVFDTANNRMVYKDQSGTAHYWNTDGTI